MKPLKISSTASAPCKVILFGEHFVVYGKPAILAAIDKRIHVNVSIRNDTKFVINNKDIHDEISISNIIESNYKHDKLSYPIFLTAYNTLRGFDSRVGLDIKIDSQVPFGSGLGTSAAVSAALIASISNLFGSFNKHQIFLQTLEAEKLIHATPSGADPAITVTGGVIMFRKTKEPDMLIMPLEYNDLRLIIIYSGENRITGDIVNNVKRIREDNPKLFEMFANKNEEITLDAVQALRNKDYNSLGSLMLRNHELLKSLGVSTRRLDEIVEKAMQNGALGAKMTGAGGGGSVIAIAEDENRLLNTFQEYYAFIANIDKDGVRVE